MTKKPQRRERATLAAEQSFGAAVRRDGGWIEIAFGDQRLRLAEDGFWPFMELMSKAAIEYAAAELEDGGRADAHTE